MNLGRAMSVGMMFSTVSYSGGGATARGKSTRKYLRRMEQAKRKAEKAADRKKPKLKPGQLPLP